MPCRKLFSTLLLRGSLDTPEIGWSNCEAGQILPHRVILGMQSPIHLLVKDAQSPATPQGPASWPPSLRVSTGLLLLLLCEEDREVTNRLHSVSRCVRTGTTRLRTERPSAAPADSVYTEVSVQVPCKSRSSAMSRKGSCAGKKRL